MLWPPSLVSAQVNNEKENIIQQSIEYYKTQSQYQVPNRPLNADCATPFGVDVSEVRYEDLKSRLQKTGSGYELTTPTSNIFGYTKQPVVYSPSTKLQNRAATVFPFKGYALETGVNNWYVFAHENVTGKNTSVIREPFLREAFNDVIEGATTIVTWAVPVGKDMLNDFINKINDSETTITLNAYHGAYINPKSVVSHSRYVFFLTAENGEVGEKIYLVTYPSSEIKNQIDGLYGPRWTQTIFNQNFRNLCEFIIEPEDIIRFALAAGVIKPVDSNGNEIDVDVTDPDLTNNTSVSGPEDVTEGSSICGRTPGLDSTLLRWVFCWFLESWHNLLTNVFTS